jgi:hypothetical protein
MNTRIRILLALLGCLVIGANALAIDLGHCDPVCCEKPCDPVAPTPVECGYCTLTATAEASPMLVSVASPTPAPALLPVLPELAPASVETFSLDSLPSLAPPPAPARSTILRN